MEGPSKKENIFQFIKFAVFSASAGIIEAGAFALTHELTSWPYWPSYLTALVLSILWNFTLNRRYTFRSAANVPAAMAKVFGFYCVFTPASTWLGNWLTGTVGVPDYLVLAGTMILNFVLEFLFCRFVVYKDSINTREIKREKIA